MKFVISWINFFDNNLHSEIVEAEDLLAATKLAYARFMGIDYGDTGPQEVESVKQLAFDCDGMVNAIEI